MNPQRASPRIVGGPPPPGARQIYFEAPDRRAISASFWRHSATLSRSAHERYVTTPWLWRYEPDAVELGWTTLRLGELQERLGLREAAVRTYSRLLRLWDRSDPPLRRVLDDVRARLAVLTGEPGA